MRALDGSGQARDVRQALERGPSLVAADLAEGVDRGLAHGLVLFLALLGVGQGLVDRRRLGGGPGQGLDGRFRLLTEGPQGLAGGLADADDRPSGLADRGRQGLDQLLSRLAEAHEGDRSVEANRGLLVAQGAAERLARLLDDLLAQEPEGLSRLGAQVWILAPERLDEGGSGAGRVGPDQPQALGGGALQLGALARAQGSQEGLDRGLGVGPDLAQGEGRRAWERLAG